MPARETPATSGRPGLLGRLRLGSPLTRVAVLGIPLAAMVSTLSASGNDARWVVPSSASSGDKVWLDGLVGSVPNTGTGRTPAPDVAVLPAGGNPQVLVLPGPGGGGEASAHGASAAAGAPDTGALTGSGIPVRVLQAYLAAAKQTAAVDPGCHLSWSLIAGIGRVETDHGRFGGAHVDAGGTVSPPIYGPRLDGTNGMPFIHDTDGGRLDADPTSDRAVGPMQFLPGTWAAYGTDADGDGVANPQDVDDAALSAASYLCDGDADLSTQAGRFRAVFRYNQSTSYVRLVLALADSYASGEPVPAASEPAVPVAPGGRSATVGTPLAVTLAARATRPGTRKPAPASTSKPTPGTPKPTPSVTSEAKPSPSASPSPNGSPSEPPTPSPTPSSTPTPSPTEAPSPTPAPSPSPSPSPTPSPSPSPGPTPSPSPSPTPSPSPSGSSSASPSPAMSTSPSTSASTAASASPSPSS